MKDFLKKILNLKSSLLIPLLGGSAGLAIGTIYEKILPMGVTLSLIVLVGVLIGLVLPPRC